MIEQRITITLPTEVKQALDDLDASYREMAADAAREAAAREWVEATLGDAYTTN
jgi:hypothetical protein